MIAADRGALGALAALALGAVVLAGALLVVARKVLGARWATIGWGALSFVAAQAVRLPLLAAVGLAGNVPVLVLTSGLFEESARWLALRYGDRRADRWRDGVAFGIGHGGIEALLVLGTGAVAGAALLLTGEAALDAARTVGPEQGTALAEQLEALRTAGWGTTALALWERVLAVVFHVAASLLVLRAVREARPRWLAAAVALHCALNATLVTLLPIVGPVAVELGFTLLAVALLALVRAARRWPAVSSWPTPS